MSAAVLELVVTEEMRRQAWLEDRRTCITGTQISAIMGLNHWARPIDVWAEKKGIEIPFEVTDAILAGRAFERTILAETARRAERSLILADPFEMIRVPNFPMLGATLDARWADSGVPVDAKNIRWKDADWGDDGSDNFPNDYKLQLHVQAMAVEADSANLAVCFSGQDFFLYEMERDREVDALLQDTVTTWWQKHVIGDVPPEADGSENFTRFLKSRFSRNRLNLIPASAELVEAVGLLKNLKAQIAATETQVELAEQLIKLAVGDYEGIEGLCTWKNNRDGEKTDWKAVSAAMASDLAFSAIVKQHTTPTTGARVLRLSK